MYSKTAHERFISLQKIESAMQTIMSNIQEICPQATIKISKEKFEDEDALFYVYVPESAIDVVRNFAHKKTLDILLEDDVDIAILVNEQK
jgi:hypothetical protein